MIHALLATPVGLLLATSSDAAVFVYCRVVPTALRDDADAIHAFVRRGGFYIVAFPDAPGLLRALSIPDGWNGEPIGADHVVKRTAVIAAVGEAMFDTCCHIADTLACARYPSWAEESEQRIAGIRAVIHTAPVGEA